MTDQAFARLATLACHDLRTPLATVSGLAQTLARAGELPERDARYVEMIEEAVVQMTGLVDQLGLAARIVEGTYEPVAVEADTLELASAADERIAAEGRGETVETDAGAVRRSLAGLALAAVRYGELPAVTWTVSGRELVLAPLPPRAAGVVTGEPPRDVGALVARLAIERLGGSVAVEGETLRVVLTDVPLPAGG